VDVVKIAEFALLCSRFLLAFVFLLAGATKLVDPAGLRKATREFGLPAVLAPPVILLLPLVELAVVVALIPARLAWYGSCGALVLLSGFLIVIGIAMARGRKPDCRCFGRLHSKPVSGATLLRDGALAGCAAWVVSRGRLRAGPDLWAWLIALDSHDRKIALITGCVAGFLFFRLLDRARPRPPEPPPPPDLEDEPTPQPRSRQRAPAPAPPPELPPSTARGVGLPVGTPAPEFELPALTGDKRSLQSLRAQGGDLLLVFSSPFCESCHALVPLLVRWTQELNGSWNIVLISRGTIAENRAKLQGFDPSRVLMQRAFEISEAYDCNATPTAVLIGADGRIGSELAVGRQGIQQLVASRHVQLDRSSD
jgi:peroxiredoxin